MKKLIALVCVLFATPSFADVEYVAKLQEDGTYCARVELEGPGAMRFQKTKCRTLEAWKNEGYTIKTTDGQEVEIQIK